MIFFAVTFDWQNTPLQTFQSGTGTFFCSGFCDIPIAVTSEIFIIQSSWIKKREINILLSFCNQAYAVIPAYYLGDLVYMYAFPGTIKPDANQKYCVCTADQAVPDVLKLLRIHSMFILCRHSNTNRGRKRY